MSTKDLKDSLAGKAVAPINPYDKLRMQIMQRRTDFVALLGNRVDQFVQAVLTAVAHRPELLDADRASLILACRMAAIDGLYPDGKDAVLNIYRTNVGSRNAPQWARRVQYLPMVRGLIRAMWRTGQFAMLDAAAVYERDHFVYRRGDSPCIEHLPYSGTEDPGEIIAAYFVAKTTAGEMKREVMWARDIARARAKSKTPDSGPWVDWPDQMAIKTVIHRAAKQLDLEPAVEKVLEGDMKAALGDMGELLPETAGEEPLPEAPLARQERVEVLGPGEPPSEAPPTQPASSEPAASAALNPSEADLLRVAMRSVRAGEYDTARDLARALPDAVKDEIERAIQPPPVMKGGKA